MAERILVAANETLGAQNLIEQVLPFAEDKETEFFLVVPQSRPKQGNVIYLEAMYDAAQVRVDLAREFMERQGVKITGEVGDPDPYTAIMDATREFRPTRLIISTLPETSSGWLRRDLIERVEQSTGLPVTHVVSDPDTEGLPFKVTLVIANQTIRGRQLTDRLKQLAEEEQRLFIIVVPQEGGEGHHSTGAKRRLAAMLRELDDQGLIAAGMIADPDPYLASVNALQTFRVSEVIISTFPNMRSRWMRAHLIERVQNETAAPVEHVVVDLEGSTGVVMEAASVTLGDAAHSDDHHDHHGPPPANRSSRVDPQLLGMLLFIISEIMIFAAFFTAYFFIRVVVTDAQWPGPGFELPVDIAGVNTGILLSSSLTLHWALVSIKNGNRLGLKAGMVATFLLGLTFLIIQINEYIHLGIAGSETAQASIFYGLTGLHGAHVFIGLVLLAIVCVRVYKGHFSPEHHDGVEIPGIYWHFVDIMWIVVFSTIYIL